MQMCMTGVACSHAHASYIAIATEELAGGYYYIIIITIYSKIILSYKLYSDSCTKVTRLALSDS